MTVTIRPAQEADGDAVAGIRVASSRAAYAGIFPASYLASMDPNHEHWRAASAGQLDGVELIVCELDGTVVGFACYGPARPPVHGFGGEIYAMYFDPDAIGKGFGAATMKVALAGLLRRGFQDAMLWVLEENARARRFYERQSGIVVAGSRQSMVVDGQTVWEIAYGFRPIGR